jgi:hypothetical protein
VVDKPMARRPPSKPKRDDLEKQLKELADRLDALEQVLLRYGIRA